jgi:hypothetical protein
MGKAKRINLFPIIALLFLFVAIYVYDPIASVSGWPMSLSDNFTETGLFRINPETILTSLDEENADVFLPDSRSLDDRVMGPILYEKSTLQRQSDYLKIARALDNFVWGGTLDDWNLLWMIFNANCQDNFTGLTGGVFQYFKTVFEKGRIAYTWREIEIDPEYAYVAWGDGAEFAHPLLGYKSINLSRIKVTAEEAIRIAEVNGGKEARLEVQNRCNIHLLLLPERFRGWVINYQSSDFEIQIDPYTGEVIK